MNTPEHYTLRITVLSPVHMGTDEDYVPTNYVMDSGKLHALGLNALTRLSRNAREQLDQITQGRGTERALLDIQSLFYEERTRLMEHATHQVDVASGVEALYQQRVGKVAQHEAGGRNVLNQLQIERAAYNPATQGLIFPGSGLKGAMRTALLDGINNGADLPKDLKDEDARDGSGIARNASQRLQQRLFDYLNEDGKQDLSLDPLRLVQLMDAMESERAARRVLFAVNRRKKRGEHASQAEQKGLYQLLECAMPGSILRGEMRFLPTPPKHAPQWRFTLKDIAGACNRFYKPILEQELRQMSQRGLLLSAWMHSIEQLLRDAALRQRMQAGKAMLLRVGRHSGAESVTLNGVRHIKIMLGGKRSTWEKQAGTWWLAAEQGKDQNSGLVPFGWILVEEASADLPNYNIVWKSEPASFPTRAGMSPAEIARAKQKQAASSPKKTTPSSSAPKRDGARLASAEALQRLKEKFSKK